MPRSQYPQESFRSTWLSLFSTQTPGSYPHVLSLRPASLQSLEFPCSSCLGVSRHCSSCCLMSKVVLSVKVYHKESNVQDTLQQIPGRWLTLNQHCLIYPMESMLCSHSKLETPGSQARVGWHRPLGKAEETENRYYYFLFLYLCTISLVVVITFSFEFWKNIKNI